MKNYTHLIILLLFYAISYGQEQPIETKLPTVIPPSPSVAALMKFEEYPVNNYTGIPNIAIPLYNVSTIDNALGINLSLNYHPASAAGEEAAANTGLGWSIMAGGTISRTVKGLPDEISHNSRYGIRTSQNNYDDIVGMLDQSAQFAKSEYMWDTYMKGKYDTEYDLYQYNFMGYTGRFILNTDLEVVKLDKNTLKINYHQGSGTDTDYFEIYDDKGNKYRFDVREKTTQQTWSLINFMGDGETASPSSVLPQYTSAYHLSTVTSKTNRLIIEFFYSAPMEEQIKNMQTTKSQIIYLNQNTVINDIGYVDLYTGARPCGFPPEEYQKLQPAEKRTINHLFIQTRKLDYVIVVGKAKIDFEYEIGRSDDNIENSEDVSKLKSIVISRKTTDVSFTNFKKFTFNYFYSDVASMGSRLMLENVVESNYIDTKTQKHSFSYDDYYKVLGLNSGGRMSHDYWGYFNSTPLTNPQNKEVSPIVCASDMLQKIVYPTGGCAVFDYEPNTYSYIGHQALEDHNADLTTSEFNPNPDNWDISTEQHSLSVSSANNYTAVYEFSATIGQPEALTIRANNQDDNGSLVLEKYVSGQWQFVTALNGQNAIYDMGLLVGFYRIKFTNFNIQSGSASAGFWLDYKTRLIPTRKWLYGGGVRIKRIGYFDQSVDPYYYRDPYIASQEPAPVKEKNYSYQFFNDTWRSSGSMVSPRPVYTDTIRRTYITGGTETCPYYPKYDFTYRLDYSSSIAAEVQSQGGYVGYKNVTVSETGNGKTTYEYTSSIDVPEDETASRYPFFPIATHDYKKGNLLAERIFNEAGQKLQETIYEYDPAAMQEFTEMIGIQVYGDKWMDCPKASSFTTYSDYVDAVEQCSVNGTQDPMCDLTCGPSESFILYEKSFHHFGWVKLTRKINREYFNDASGQHLIESIEDFTYNNLNMKVASYKKQVYSGSSPEFIEMHYSYHLPAGYTTSNRISDIAQVKTYRNGSEISLRSITYDGNAPYLPFIVSESKGGQALEERVRFKAYNEYGNILELQQTDGNTISYIWGYNKSQPIAMLENASNTQIALSLGVNYSDINEANITAINNLRTALPDAMITTYTHEPLIGIKTMTDPRGYTTFYDYDPFGRLISVKDDQGNLLSENKYNFRP